MAILKLYSEKTGMTYEVAEESLLCEVLLGEGFMSIESPEAKEDITEAQEEVFEGNEDLRSMTKAELIDLAELLGIQVKSKDSMATLVKKIQEAKGEI